MDRRSFVLMSITAPFLLLKLAAGSSSSDRGLPVLEAGGTYREIGFAIGKRFAAKIRTVIQRRAAWHENLMKILASATGRHRASELLRLTGTHFPQVLEEVRGMADGAGIAFEVMWAMTIKSELGALEAAPPGCSTVFFSNRDRAWLCHNEDGHAAYADQMFVVRANPPSGVSFVSMVYPGILMGNGPSLNSNGVVQTTNYIGCTRSEVGVPRYVLGRAILEAKDLKEARQIATFTPRAHPYHHNLASSEKRRYYSLETVPGAAVVGQPKGIYVHTNHLVFEGTRDYPYEDVEYRQTSSMPRYAVLSEFARVLARARLRQSNLLAMLSSHERAPYSPCRHPLREVRGQTLGTAFFDLRSGTFRLYHGNPCVAVRDGDFTELSV